MSRFSRLLLACFLFPIAAFSHTLQDQTEAEIAQILSDEIPELQIESIQLISEGWDNLVADVNDEWIFRFPRSESFLAIYERELKLLDRLHDKVFMPIPYYEFVGKETAFVGYRKLKGVAFEAEDYLALTEDEKQAVAKSMAIFLTQMHTAVTADEAREWGYQEYSVPLAWIEQSIFGTLSPELEVMISEALEFYYKNPPTHLVLIHNDLHGGNMVFDPVSHRIAGVFDFSDAVVADYTIEFGKLFNIHPDLEIRTAACYAEMNQVENPTLAAAIDFILRRVTYILVARESGNTKREAQLIRMLSNFRPVWNEIAN